MLILKSSFRYLGPVVIPWKPNPYWREAVRKRRAGAAGFTPDSAKASTGADGSVGGIGKRDTINSGPQLSGIQFSNKEVKVDTSKAFADEETNMMVEEHAKVDIAEETEDQKALRALLAGYMEAPQIESIPVPPSKTDDKTRYALRHGLGGRWAVTSSERAKKNALVEPYLPKSRLALLGIGAKEQEVLDDGSKKKRRG
ncbi:hypothetical protein DFJ58DRAFT_731494 [Suillus subalutaceus]|uniref:uncharacterized protein n=1 Tax=Suillus subalutaceus TaxID=48586 RepID=UPI001B874F10|nr:uncharacterized protein DFJ58DRAFT_731494 [Suillus subalutaceus]KAG1843827.1 hypothetical protein DFJ58DRAFT_731494 [Suillus subalutaceus]